MKEKRKPKEPVGKPTLDDHPGLDNDEATDAGKMMTASGSLGPNSDDERREGDNGDTAGWFASRGDGER